MSNIKTLRTGLGLDPQSSDPSNPVQGQIQYADGTVRPEGLWIYDGSAWVQAGGGAGGGLDVFYTNDFETEASSGFTTGQNATFDNGGTIGGALSDETSSPLSGDTSVKYVTDSTAGNSDDDFFATSAISLDLKQRGNWAGFSFVYTWDGSDDLVEFVVWDDTNNEKLTTPTSDLLKEKSNSTRYSTAVYIPESCASIKIGFHHTGASESSKTLIFDDLQVSTNPFVYKELVDTQAYSISQSTNALTNRADEIQFNLGTATITNNGESLIVAEDDTSNTRTRFVAQKKCTVTIDFSSPGTANRPVCVTKNGTIYQVGGDVSTGGAIGQVNASMELNQNDFFTVGLSNNSKGFAGSSLPSSAVPADITFIAEALTEHVVTPARSNLSDYKVEQGITIEATTTDPTKPSVVDTEEILYRQVGSNLDAVYKYYAASTSGAASGSGDYLFTLPNGLEFDTNVVDFHNTVESTGNWQIANSQAVGYGTLSDGTNIFRCTAVPWDATRFRLLVTNSSASGQAAMGSAGPNLSCETISITLNAPISGWTSEAQFLAAIPKPLTAILEHRETNNTVGGTYTAGSWQTRPLTEIHPDSDSSFVTISSNEFTLQPGNYDLDYWGQNYAIGGNKCRIYDVTNSTALDILGSGGGTTTDGITQFMKGSLSLSAATTLRVEVRGASTRANQGMGFPTNFGEDEVYAQLKITKLP